MSSGKYSHYSDWYDNGPGSEKFIREIERQKQRRKLSSSVKWSIEKFLSIAGFTEEESEDEEFIRDDDLLI